MDTSSHNSHLACRMVFMVVIGMVISLVQGYVKSGKFQRLLTFLHSDTYFWFFVDCPSGWLLFNSSCYTCLTSDSVMAFARAEQLCMEEQTDSHLPSIHSIAELSFLVEMGRREGWFGEGRGVYLGGTLVEGKVVWTDGSLADFTFWGEESMPTSSSGCLAVFSSMVWKETSCYMDSERGMQDLVICKVKKYSTWNARQFGKKEKMQESHSDMLSVFNISVPQQMIKKMFVVVFIIFLFIIIVLLGIIFVLLHFTCKISCNCSRKKKKEKSSHKKTCSDKEIPKEMIKNQCFVSLGKTKNRSDFI